jgi:RNA polymerase sigma factor (sigma-70 family)
MEDDALITECIDGKQRAQRLLFDKFAPKMLGVCMRYAANKEQAEDVLQDSFIKVFAKLKDFKREGSLEGWIRRIVVNTSLDAIRKEVKHTTNVSVDDVGFKLVSNANIVEKLNALDLLDMVQKLPTGYKAVFNLYAIEGYSHADIADVLGISENTSKSQYSRAKQMLREKLSNIYGGDGR